MEVTSHVRSSNIDLYLTHGSNQSCQVGFALLGCSLFNKVCAKIASLMSIFFLPPRQCNFHLYLHLIVYITKCPLTSTLHHLNKKKSTLNPRQNCAKLRILKGSKGTPRCSLCRWIGQPDMVICTSNIQSIDCWIICLSLWKMERLPGSVSENDISKMLHLFAFIAILGGMRGS